MIRFRNGLLITAILVSVAGAAAFGAWPSHASTVKVSVSGVAPAPVSPASNPDSGEPDDGSSRTQAKSSMRSLAQGEHRVAFTWGNLYVRWISRIWIAKYLGRGL